MQNIHSLVAAGRAHSACICSEASSPKLQHVAVAYACDINYPCKSCIPSSRANIRTHTHTTHPSKCFRCVRMHCRPNHPATARRALSSHVQTNQYLYEWFSRSCVCVSKVDDAKSHSDGRGWGRGVGHPHSVRACIILSVWWKRTSNAAATAAPWTRHTQINNCDSPRRTTTGDNWNVMMLPVPALIQLLWLWNSIYQSDLQAGWVGGVAGITNTPPPK